MLASVEVMLGLWSTRISLNSDMVLGWVEGMRLVLCLVLLWCFVVVLFLGSLEGLLVEFTF